MLTEIRKQAVEEYLRVCEEARRAYEAVEAPARREMERERALAYQRYTETIEQYERGMLA